MARYVSGHRIREARIAAGISVEQLALQINRGAYSVHEYERGRVQPPVAVLDRIATTLGRCIEDLLAEEAAHAA